VLIDTEPPFVLRWPFALFSCCRCSHSKVLSLCLAKGHLGVSWINELVEPVKHLMCCSRRTRHKTLELCTA